MCGRYAAATTAADWVEEFEVTDAPERVLAPDYNVAPTKEMYLIAAGEDDGEAARRMEIARWGLIPSWAKEASIATKMTNARVETVSEKPSFRSAFAKRRCLIPADGYYEWYRPEKGAKQPFYIHRTDGRSLAMAGLYEWWRDPSNSEAEPRLTCTVITTAATAELAVIHDRMPVMIDESDWAEWLDPSVPGKELPLPMLEGGFRLVLVAEPVSVAVGNVRNNGPSLITPIAPNEGLLF
jgi:putative SOS response-associated peptidase YedK